MKKQVILNQIKNFWLATLLVLLFLKIPGLSEKNDNLQVISLAPHVTEIIFKLDAGHLIIGRTDFCNFPPLAEQIESVGGYLNIDFEKVVRFQPDLILQFPNQENRRKLEGLGFQVLDIPNETIDEIFLGIRKVGEALNRSEEARILIENIQDTLTMAAEMRQGVGVPLPAILVVGRDRDGLGNIHLAGPNSYLSELWELCGGMNAFPEVELRYFSVNEEDLLKRDIEVILEFHPGWPSEQNFIEAAKESWNLLNHLEAVEKDYIYIYTDRFFVIPGPRISRVANSFMHIIQNYDRNR